MRNPMIRRIMTVARKEFLHIRRDPRMIGAIFMVPLIQLFLFGYALSFDIRNINTAVLDHDLTPESRKLITSFESSGYFTVVRYLGKENDIDDTLDRGIAKVAITIPKGFARDVTAGGKPAVQILIDGADPNTAVVARGYTTAISQSFSGRILFQALERRGASAGRQPTPLDVSTRVWYNPKLQGIAFMLPGLIVVIMANLTIIQTTLALVREKATGTIEQLIVSPLHPFELMLGKIAPFLVITFFDVLMITFIGVIGFQVPFRGSLFLLALGAALFTLAGLAMGLLISAITNTMESANQLASFVGLLPTFLLSGFIFNLDSMPVPLQALSYLFPGRYFMFIVRGIFLKGVGLSVLGPNLAALLLYSLVAIALSIVSFREKVG